MFAAVAAIRLRRVLIEPGVMVKPSPSGGAMIRLPGNRGFSCIKTEGPAASRAGRSRPTTKHRRLFFETDGVNADESAPDRCRHQLGDRAEKPRQVPLTPDPKDPNRFVSSPGPYTQGLQGRSG